MILLYHVDNFSAETRRQLLISAGNKIKEISNEGPFTGCPFQTLKRVIKVAIKEIGSSLSAKDIIEAILIWGSENSNGEMTASLLSMVPMDDLHNNDLDALRNMAKEYGLEHLAAVIFDRRYYESILSPHRINLNETYVVKRVKDQTPIRLVLL
ncbi:hypothetical protein OESDEN_06649, partial [Oesophagostomum dentatum]